MRDEIINLPPLGKTSHFNLTRLHDRWGDPPHVTLPTWAPPQSSKQALNGAILETLRPIG